MRRPVSVLMVALLLLAISGCSSAKLKETVITPWDKWVKTPVTNSGDDTGTPDLSSEAAGGQEATIPVALYYLKDGSLARQMKQVPKVEGIARRTLEELFNNPAPSGFKSAFPNGLRLNDINLKPDGTCIIDLGPEILKLKGIAKKTAISALTKTLGQYPTIKQVKILVNGEEVPEWIGPWQVGSN